MQTNIRTTTATAAIALTVVLLSPGSPGTVIAVAKENEPASQEPQGPVVAGQPDPVLTQLMQVVPVDFDDNQLVNVIDYFRNATNANFFVAWPALQKVGVTQNAPVTLMLHDTRCNTALSLVLQWVSYQAESPVDYTIIDGVVVISTKNEIDRRMVLRIYDCVDLVEQGRKHPLPHSLDPDTRKKRRNRRPTIPRIASSHTPRIHELAQAVNQLIGTTGSVSVYDKTLIVRQTPTVHQEVQQLLALLHQAIAQRRD